jgi:hypothetical protein
VSRGHIAPGRGPSRTKAAWAAQVRVPAQCGSYSHAQLSLFAEPEPKCKRGGSVGRGPKGLLRRLVQQGLDPDTLVPAARLIQLLDEDAGGSDEGRA